jgi:hypothetical protein
MTGQGQRKNSGSARRVGWLRVGGAVVGVAATLALSLGAGAGTASASTCSTTTGISSVISTTCGVVQPAGVRWQ